MLQTLADAEALLFLEKNFEEMFNRMPADEVAGRLKKELGRLSQRVRRGVCVLAERCWGEGGIEAVTAGRGGVFVFADWEGLGGREGTKLLQWIRVGMAAEWGRLADDIRLVAKVAVVWGLDVGLTPNDHLLIGGVVDAPAQWWWHCWGVWVFGAGHSTCIALARMPCVSLVVCSLAVPGHTHTLPLCKLPTGGDHRPEAELEPRAAAHPAHGAAGACQVQ
jgi:hypothetical protein